MAQVVRLYVNGNAHRYDGDPERPRRRADGHQIRLRDRALRRLQRSRQSARHPRADGKRDGRRAFHGAQPRDHRRGRARRAAQFRRLSAARPERRTARGRSAHRSVVRQSMRLRRNGQYLPSRRRFAMRFTTPVASGSGCSRSAINCAKASRADVWPQVRRGPHTSAASSISHHRHFATR